VWIALAACGGGHGMMMGDDGDDDGMPDAGPVATDEDGDGVMAPLDCDDRDPSVYPGAPELCDGKVNACGTTASEDGLIAFFPTTGKPRDVTAMAANGRMGAPVPVDLGEESGTLRFCAGTFYVSVVSSAPTFALRGASATTTVLSGGEIAAVVTVTSASAALTLADVTLRDGSAASGGALAGTGTLTVDRAVFTHNSAGGVAPDGWSGAVMWIGAATIRGSSFTGNASATAGGALGVQGSLTLRDSQVTGNTSGFGGGVATISAAAATADPVTFDTVELSNNAASQNGGGAFLQTAAGTLTHLTVINNHATGDGGGVGLIGGTIAIADAMFKDNFGSNGGGGLALDTTDGTVTRARFETNQSVHFVGTRPSVLSGFGGAIEIIDSKLRVTDSTVLQNRGRWGFGMFVQNTDGGVDVDVVNTTFTSNINIVGDGGSATLEYWRANSMQSTVLDGAVGFHCGDLGCTALDARSAAEAVPGAARPPI